MNVTPRLLASAVLAGLWACGVSACADIWGFQDGRGESAEGGQASADAGPADGGPDAAGPANGGSDADGEPADGGSHGEGAPTGGRSNANAPPSDASESATDVSAPVACALACIAAPPPGWSGPYALSEAVGGAKVASCSTGGYPLDVYDGVASPSAPAASCDCQCGPPAGGRCNPPTVTLSHGMCNPGSQCATADMSLGACVDFDTKACGGARMELSPPAPVPGSCVASASTNVPDARWTASARLCGIPAPPPGSCASGEVCAPPVELPFVSCIAKVGLSACPSGAYSHRRVYFGTATDTRGCTSCSCGEAVTSCTGGTVATFSKADCAAPSHATWSLPQTCVAAGGDTSAVYMGDAIANTGACAPMGGQPTGQFTPEDPTTICCTQ